MCRTCRWERPLCPTQCGKTNSHRKAPNGECPGRVQEWPRTTRPQPKEKPAFAWSDWSSLKQERLQDRSANKLSQFNLVARRRIPSRTAVLGKCLRRTTVETM